MPVSISVFSDACLFVYRFFDGVSEKDLNTLLSGEFPDMDGWPNMFSVTDLHDVQSVHVSTPMIRDHAERAANRLSCLDLKNRSVIIAPSDHLYGLAHAYCIQAAYCRIEDTTCVRTIEDAANWIGLTTGALSDYLCRSRNAGGGPNAAER